MDNIEKFKNLGIREKNAAKTRQKISEVLFELLKTKKYDDISVKDICQTAEVAEATFYNYFPRKTDIVFYSVKIEGIGLIYESIMQKSKNPLIAAEKLMERMAEEVENFPLWYELVSVLVKEGKPETKIEQADLLLMYPDKENIENQVHTDIFDYLEFLLESAKAEKLLKSNFDVSMALVTLEALVCGAMSALRNNKSCSMKVFYKFNFKKICENF